MKRIYTTETPPALTGDQLAQLEALDGDEPDTVDIPPAPVENWNSVRRFSRVRKKPISICLVADLLD